MCGRVFQTYNINQILRIAGTKLIRNPDRYEPSYNVAPTNYLPIVKHKDSGNDGPDRVVDLAKWGYDSPFNVFMINARAEDLQEKRTFRPLMDTSRCVVIVEGFFQWNPRREPYVFRPMNYSKHEKDEVKPPHFLLAGLCAPDDTLILLTKEAIGDLGNICPRMPVILEEDEVDKWLNYEKYEFEDIQADILDPSKDKWQTISFYHVAPYIGHVWVKSEKVLMRFEDYENEVESNGIKKYFSPVGSPNKDIKAHDHEENQNQNTVEPTEDKDTEESNIDKENDQEAKVRKRVNVKKQDNNEHNNPDKSEQDKEQKEMAEKRRVLKNEFQSPMDSGKLIEQPITIYDVWELNGEPKRKEKFKDQSRLDEFFEQDDGSGDHKNDMSTHKDRHTGEVHQAHLENFFEKTDESSNSRKKEFNEAKETQAATQQTDVTVTKDEGAQIVEEKGGDKIKIELNPVLKEVEETLKGLDVGGGLKVEKVIVVLEKDDLSQSIDKENSPEYSNGKDSVSKEKSDSKKRKDYEGKNPEGTVVHHYKQTKLDS